ncbi:hypothetical protein ARMSODRAFT_1021781 [Armillaria solidipes]|uniref:Uncharacterized protein n=1 Tax=Armillaria solidipes TaxID=1076256 RepID=A0A2H3B5L2_9AGAR|nr:hypothetical protein ARMSODRAFT_1021781 [Armillaria solidipes]
MPNDADLAEPSARPQTWHDFLEDPDPVIAAMVQEMKDTPTRIHASRKYYLQHMDELQLKAHARVHAYGNMFSQFDEEQSIVKEKA